MLTDCMFTNNFVSGRPNNDGHGGAGGSGFGGGIYNAGFVGLDRCTFYRDSGSKKATLQVAARARMRLSSTPRW